MKRFAYYREIADGYFSEAGLQAYLVLLSLSVTCTGPVSFFQFLLSREKDIDVFGTAQSSGERPADGRACPGCMDVLPSETVS